MPSRWLEQLDDEAIALLITRRLASIQSGGRKQGLLIGLTWNAVGFITSGVLLPGAGVTSVSELTTLALGFTLFSFLGLLVLPSFSRGGVFYADQIAAVHNSNKRLEGAILVLDQLQDDEPVRSAVVEAVFHPLPSVRNRLRRFSRPDLFDVGNAAVPWNTARMNLYLSWAGLGLLSRAVHCNAGRPDLWVLLPVD